LLILTGCFRNKSTFDHNGSIEKHGKPIKVEYFKHITSKAFQYSDTATFVIIDQSELKTVINEIKYANNPEHWKGAGWDRIKITYIDTILNIYTDKTKIGMSASGIFYTLNKQNFIVRRIEQKYNGSS
jgi:hypothetical protein